MIILHGFGLGYHLVVKPGIGGKGGITDLLFEVVDVFGIVGNFIQNLQYIGNLMDFNIFQTVEKWF